MLSGHTHGGQVWPFSLLVALEYIMVNGRHEVGGMTLLVCRGTGTWGPRMHLWQPSEILNITLRSQAQIPTAMDAGTPIRKEYAATAYKKKEEQFAKNLN